MTHPQGTLLRRMVSGTALGLGLGLAIAGCSTGSGSTEASISAAQTAPTTTQESPTTGATTQKSTTPPPPSSGPAALKLDTVTNNEHKYAVVASTVGQAEGTQTLSGKLIIAENGCFHATTRNGPPTLLIFPAGTTLNANGKPSVMLDGMRLPVGAPINLTGEAVTLGQEASAQAKPCVARGEVFQITALSK